MIHNFNPIAIDWNGIILSWYWLSYIVGFWWVVFFGLRQLRNSPSVSPQLYLTFLQWALPLMIISSRLFYVLFYHPQFFWDHPEYILQFWRGGMSFHGALILPAIFGFFLARRHQISFYRISDLLALSAPMALMLGRLANFINGELFGRPSSLPWAMIFPLDPERIPRHPSQIYQALTEGLLLGIYLWCRRAQIKTPGILTCHFLMGYGGLRFLVEFTRQPDSQLGLFGFLSFGQYLCLGMLAIGLFLNHKIKKENLP